MKREITKRGVLYVGFRCNARCKFCYYRYLKNKTWRGINELKKQALKIRYFYRNGFLDITGGEPTIYPHIFELLEHCRKIGLKPTLITNGLVLADKDKCREFKKSGLNDFLVSIFGLDETTKHITGVKNIVQKQEKTLENFNELNIPFRINVTVHKFTTPQLLEIANFAVNKGARAVNMIIFNPFYEWQHLVNIEFQERYSQMAFYIEKAIKILEENGREANVRFLPLCQLKGQEKNVYNFRQLSFDPSEWDFNAWDDSQKIRPGKNWYKKEAIQKTVYDCGYQKSKKCRQCSLNEICDGFHNQYVKRFGFNEEKPYFFKKKIKDPTYFIQNQVKIEYPYQKPDQTMLKYLLKDRELILDLLKSRKYLRFIDRIDREIGKAGIFFKKRFPRLYFKLKKIKK